jgi:transposase
LSISPQRRRLGLYLHWHPGRNVTRHEVLVFLRNLRAHLAGPIVLVWDRLGAHRSAAARLRETRCRRIQIEWFPPYAPEFNPVEYLWSHLKAHRLANHGFLELDEIHHHARDEAKRVASQQNLLRSFVRASKLPIRLR